jgi:ethanolaminephosphotransferase
MFHLTSEDVEVMLNHKYTSAGYTWLDKQLNPFWNFCAALLPKWLSPNMVTLLGYFSQVIMLFLIIPYDSSLSKQLPSYVYIISVICMFMGQTFDAIDGKHARNLKKSSSLGQLMDHGCDAMSNFLSVIIIAQAHCFGPSLSTLILQCGISIQFYTLTLEENFTGVLRTNVDNIGVTEYQFFGMFVVLLPAFIGQLFSNITLPVINMSLASFLLILSFLSSVKSTVQVVFESSLSIKDGLNKWYGLGSYFALTVAQFLVLKMKVYQLYCFYIVILNGLHFGLLTCKLIIYNMAKKKVKFFDLDVFVFVMGMFVAFMSGDIVVEAVIMGLLLVWMVVRFYIIVIGTIRKLVKRIGNGF